MGHGDWEGALYVGQWDLSWEHWTQTGMGSVVDQHGMMASSNAGSCPRAAPLSLTKDDTWYSEPSYPGHVCILRKLGLLLVAACFNTSMAKPICYVQNNLAFFIELRS